MTDSNGIAVTKGRDAWDFRESVASNGIVATARALGTGNWALWLVVSSVAHFASWNFVSSILEAMDRYAEFVLGEEVVVWGTEVLANVHRTMGGPDIRGVLTYGSVAVLYVCLLHVSVAALTAECVRQSTRRLSLHAIVKVVKSTHFIVAVLRTVLVVMVLLALAMAYVAGLFAILSGGTWADDMLTDHIQPWLGKLIGSNEVAFIVLLVPALAVGYGVPILYSFCWLWLYVRIVAAIVGVVDRGFRAVKEWRQIMGMDEDGELEFTAFLPLGLGLLVWSVAGRVLDTAGFLGPFAFAQWFSAGAVIATLIGTLMASVYVFANEQRGPGLRRSEEE